MKNSIIVCCLSLFTFAFYTEVKAEEGIIDSMMNEAQQLFNKGDAKVTAKENKMKMNSLRAKINKYKLENSNYPASLDDLVICDSEEDETCTPVAEENDIFDPYENKYEYKVEGETFTITSLGADNKKGGEGADADITVTGP